ncbi:MAG: DUF2959 family protein [Planctomycetota bacterium]
MHVRALTISFVLTLPAVFALGACGSLSFSKDTKYGIGEVDDLLVKVEQVQVETVLSKEKSAAALEALRAIVDPSFQGDAVAAYSHLMGTIEQSKTQAQKLGSTAEPMKQTATNVFQQWTLGLESFGNTQLRQQSQTRLEDTRARYENVLRTLVASQIAYDSFNADLHDHALFLEHDFNAGAVSVIASQIDGLAAQRTELDARLDRCIAASKDYIESGALPGQLGEPETKAPPPAPVKTTPTQSPRRVRTKTPVVTPPAQPVAPPKETTPVEETTDEIGPPVSEEPTPDADKP